MTQPKVAICAVARTPIGKFMGSLSGFTAVDLGVLAVKELCQRAGIEAKSGVVDEVIFGQVLQAGAGQNPARQVALGAGLPYSTPCVTINKVCGIKFESCNDRCNRDSIQDGKSHYCWRNGVDEQCTLFY